VSNIILKVYRNRNRTVVLSTSEKIALSSPPHIYVSKCMYMYVHISLFLPECACTTIIDISPRIFSLIYCCCVSIIIVICRWESNLFWSREYNSAKEICKYPSFSKVGGNYPLDLKIIWSSESEFENERQMSLNIHNLRNRGYQTFSSDRLVHGTFITYCTLLITHRVIMIGTSIKNHIPKIHKIFIHVIYTNVLYFFVAV
jgi:hypothetical protein